MKIFKVYAKIFKFSVHKICQEHNLEYVNLTIFKKRIFCANRFAVKRGAAVRIAATGG